MPAKKPPTEPDQPAAQSMAGRCVMHLLERHGVPKHKHSSLLAAVLGLKYGQAHRKLTDEAAWTLEDVAKVADHFGEALADVVASGKNDASHDALMMCGSLRVPCRIWLGKIVDPAYPPQLVAVGAPGNWLVVPSTETKAYPTVSILRLVVQAPMEQATVDAG